MINDKKQQGGIMFKLLIFLFILAGCGSTNYSELSTDEVFARTTRDRQVSTITEFSIQSVGKGKNSEAGRWYLNSAKNYRSSYSLNVHLSPEVVTKLRAKYNISNINDLKGRMVRVKGIATPKYYCKKLGCPASAISKKNSHVYSNSATH